MNYIAVLDYLCVSVYVYVSMYKDLASFGSVFAGNMSSKLHFEKTWLATPKTGFIETRQSNTILQISLHFIAKL